jgi:amidase
MRPTHGRIPLDGVIPFAPSYDTVGWFARDAHLLRRVGLTLLGQPAGEAAPLAPTTTAPPPLTLCMAEDALALADAPVRDALTAWCQRHGVQTRRQAFGHEDWRHWLQAYATLQGLEIQANLGPWIRQRQPRFGPAIAPRFEAARALNPADGVNWRSWRASQALALRARIAPDEAWLLPAAPCVALPRSAAPAQLADFYERALALGSIAGHAGLPQLVLPLAQAEGLPVGVSFVAAAGRDEALLDLGVWLAPLSS